MSSPEHPQPELTGWQLHLGRVPVALRAAEPAWSGRDALLLHDLAGALAYGLDAIRAVWEQAHDEAGITGYRIWIEAASGDGPAMSATELTVGDGVVGAMLLVNAEALAVAADADIRAAQTMMADAINDIVRGVGLTSEAAGSIQAAWMQSEPTFAVRISDARTARPELPSPVELDAAFSSEAHRELARRVRAAGVNAGVYSGDDAKVLDRDVLAPAALQLLMERLAHHGAEELIPFAMVQAERAVAMRERDVRNIEQSARLTLEWDPVARLSELQSEHLLLRRCIEIIVELALRDQPRGQKPVDVLAWAELLAAAQGYLEATLRSEAVHHQVRPTAIEISDMYEIKAVAPPAEAAAPAAAGGGRVYDLDVEAAQRARVMYTMGGGGATEDKNRSEDRPDAHGERGTNLPGISATVDEAMKEIYRVSASGIITVLLALGRWPLSDSDADAVVTDVDTVIQRLSGLLTFGDEPGGTGRIRSAISMLMSRPDELRSADWRPWHARSRQRRLLIQPLAALRDDFVVVAPHFCLGSASVYINYLTQGLLPWSSPQSPPALDRALADLRDNRNRQLEDDVADALRAAGYACEVRIRETDPQRLGVPSLSGEVDAIAGRIGSTVIWLLEVKDPADVFVVPEIRRHLDRFYVTRGRDKAYADQLDAKYQDLKPHAQAIAAALGLPVAAGSAYEVRPIFVTRRPVPAAFVGGPFPFATLPDLTDILAAVE
jgi:hypothetical protein